MSLLKALLAAASPLRVPFQALLVALAGVGMAWLFLNGRWWMGALIAVLAILVGIVVDAVARQKVLPRRPVLGVYLLQSWLLIPLAIAVLASAAAIVATIGLTVPKGTPTETEKLLGSLSTGLVTFLTAAFVSWSGDKEDSQLSDHAKAAFEAKYTRPGTEKPGAHEFQPGSPGELWVYAAEVGGVEGWGWEARLARARGIAAEL